MVLWRRVRQAKRDAAEAQVRAQRSLDEAEQRRDMVAHGIVPRVDEVVAALQRHRVANHVEPMVAQAVAARRLRLVRR